MKHLQTLIKETTAGLHKHHLKWKTDDKFRYAANRYVYDAPEALIFYKPGGGQYEVSRQDQIDAVGHAISIDGAAAVAVEHRISAMQHHFWNRKPLQVKAIPLVNRVSRYGETVRATPIYGAGTFRWTQDLASHVAGADHRLIRSIWRPRRLPDEDWGHWQRRTYRGCRAIALRCGLPTLMQSMLRTKHQWAGHLARLPQNSFTSLLSRWRDTPWWVEYRKYWIKADPRNRHGWAHQRPGTYNRLDLDLFLYHYGSNWRGQAQDRDAWKRQEDDFVLALHAKLLKTRAPRIGNQ